MTSEKINGNWSEEHNDRVKTHIAEMYNNLKSGNLSIVNFMNGGVKLGAWTSVQNHVIVGLSTKKGGGHATYSTLTNYPSNTKSVWARYNYRMGNMQSSRAVKNVVRTVSISTGDNKLEVYRNLGLRPSGSHVSESDRRRALERANADYLRREHITQSRDESASEGVDPDEFEFEDMYDYLSRHPDYGNTSGDLNRGAESIRAKRYTQKMKRLKREDKQEYKHQLLLKALSRAEEIGDPRLIERIQQRLDDELDDDD